MDRDTITRTGARAPGVKRVKAACMVVHPRTVFPDSEPGYNAVVSGCTKGGGKLHDAKNSQSPGRPGLICQP